MPTTTNTGGLKKFVSRKNPELTFEEKEELKEAYKEAEKREIREKEEAEIIIAFSIMLILIFVGYYKNNFYSYGGALLAGIFGLIKTYKKYKKKKK